MKTWGNIGSKRQGNWAVRWVQEGLSLPPGRHGRPGCHPSKTSEISDAKTYLKSGVCRVVDPSSENYYYFLPRNEIFWHSFWRIPHLQSRVWSQSVSNGGFYSENDVLTVDGSRFVVVQPLAANKESFSASSSETI